MPSWRLPVAEHRNPIRDAAAAPGRFNLVSSFSGRRFTELRKLGHRSMPTGGVGGCPNASTAQGRRASTRNVLADLHRVRLQRVRLVQPAVGSSVIRQCTTRNGRGQAGLQVGPLLTLVPTGHIPRSAGSEPPAATAGELVFLAGNLRVGSEVRMEVNPRAHRRPADWRDRYGRSPKDQFLLSVWLSDIELRRLTGGANLSRRRRWGRRWAS